MNPRRRSSPREIAPRYGLSSRAAEDLERSGTPNHCGEQSKREQTKQFPIKVERGRTCRHWPRRSGCSQPRVDVVLSNGEKSGATLRQARTTRKLVEIPSAGGAREALRETFARSAQLAVRLIALSICQRSGAVLQRGIRIVSLISSGHIDCFRKGKAEVEHGSRA